MTQTELAPHQQRLAALLGKSDPSPVQSIRDGWLTELRHNPSRALEGLQRTVEEHSKDAAQSAMLARLAMQFSEDHSRAEPEPVFAPCGSPGARVNLLRDGKPVRVTLDTLPGGGYLERMCQEHREALNGKLAAQLAGGSDSSGACQFPVRQRPDDVPAWCDLCGATADLEEDDSLGSGDTPCSCHNMVIRPCRDAEACAARRAARFPPSLDRVPLWVFEAQQRITDEQSRQMVLTAIGAALGDFLELAAKEDEETGLELAGQADAPFYGVYNQRGDWLTYQPQVNVNWNHQNAHWSHVIGGHPANRAHLINGNHLTPARISAMARVTAARGAQVASDSAQEGGQGRHEIPPTGIPEGVRQAIDGDHVGGDIQAQQPQEPAGAPARPARVPRDRYGKRRYPRRAGLRNSGRR